MHENRNLFLKSKSIICTAPQTFYQYSGPVFGANADGAVFHNIAAKWSYVLQKFVHSGEVTLIKNYYQLAVLANQFDERHELLV